ncbi:MAG: haloacid dehalogenase-like hydrolase [Solirubrobacteraceae bacterium]
MPLGRSPGQRVPGGGTGRIFGAASENAGTLLLFDIDGTLLLRASAPHRHALLGALVSVYGIEDPGAHRVSAAGRTDTQIARDLATACGLAEGRFDASLEDFRAACATAFDLLCPASLEPNLAPGIPAVLATLAADPAIKLSLLTGNYEAIARTKLERAGIGHYFPSRQGAFGSDAEQRDLLGPIARARAGTASKPYPREQTVVIGDTPLDIACARADGLRVIAVATGPYDSAELVHADAVLPDAHSLPELLANARLGS